MSKKIVWITGGSSGIGEALAYLMAESGYHVCVSARSEDKLKKMAGDSNISAYPGDVTKVTQMKSIVDQILKDHGTLDIAVLCAGTASKTFGRFVSGELLSAVSLRLAAPSLVQAESRDCAPGRACGH